MGRKVVLVVGCLVVEDLPKGVVDTDQPNGLTPEGYDWLMGLGRENEFGNQPAVSELVDVSFTCVNLDEASALLCNAESGMRKAESKMRHG
jgi:hypothetical protein